MMVFTPLLLQVILSFFLWSAAGQSETNFLPTPNGCACPSPVEVIAITTLGANETIIDTGENGTGTGSFILSGVAPPETTRIQVFVTEEAFDYDTLEFGPERMDYPVSITNVDSCKVIWSVEIHAKEDCEDPYRLALNVVAYQPDFESAETRNVVIVPPKGEDVLITPAFAMAPKIADRLLAYDADEGTMIISGDGADVKIGDGLVDDGSSLAADGYFVIVQGTLPNRDGSGGIANTTIYTRPAALLDFFRQVHISVGDDEGEEIVAAEAGTVLGAPETILATNDGEGTGRSRRLATIALGNAGTLDVKPVTSISKKFKLTVVSGKKKKQAAGCKKGLGWWTPCLAYFLIEVKAVLGVDAHLEFDGIFQQSGDLVKSSQSVKVPFPARITRKIVWLDLDFRAFYDTLVDAQMDLKYNPSIEAALGYEYKPRGYGRRFYNTLVQKDTSLKDVTGTFDAKAKLALGFEFEAGIDLFGRQIVGFEAKPLLTLSAVGNSVECDIDWDVDGVTKGKLDIDIRFFGIRIVDVTKTIDEKFEADGSIRLARNVGPNVCIPFGWYIFNTIPAGTYNFGPVRSPTSFPTPGPTLYLTPGPSTEPLSGPPLSPLGGVVVGAVLEDIDNDGVGDEPLGRVGIALLEPGTGVVLASTLTDSNGSYIFGELPTGDYIVIETNPDGFVDVSDSDGGDPNMIAVTVGGAEPLSSTGNYFVDQIPSMAPSATTRLPTIAPSPMPTLFPTLGPTKVPVSVLPASQLGGVIVGAVLEDIDSDGVGDEPLGFVGIALLKSETGAVLASTLTDSSGSYIFGELPAGDYIVIESNPDGFVDVNDSDGGDPNMIAVTVGGAEPLSSTGSYFVDQIPSMAPSATSLGSISGYVSEDVDNDNTGDIPMPFVTVTLLDATSATLLETMTDSTGFYIFDDLEAGDYSVQETDPSGFTSVSDVDGDNPNVINVMIGGFAPSDSTGNDFVDELST